MVETDDKEKCMRLPSTFNVLIYLFLRTSTHDVDVVTGPILLVLLVRKWRLQAIQYLARVIRSVGMDLGFKPRHFDDQIHAVNYPTALAVKCLAHSKLSSLLLLLLLLLIAVIPQPSDHLLQFR